MARNIEIKARIDSVESMAATVALLADGPARFLSQDDTFFSCPAGRLKLRVFSDQSGELIFYQRADQGGPKTSFYERTPVAEPDSLRRCLALAYGEDGRVRKERTLFMVGRTRVHLDRVEGLGDFLELEVVLGNAEPAQDGELVARRLMVQLGVHAGDLVSGAYRDLLADLAGGDA